MNDQTPQPEESVIPPVPPASCEQCDTYKDGWKRALADYDNLKKDLSRQRDDMREAVTGGLVDQLLPILDHFDQALKFAPKDIDDKTKNWLTGVLHVRVQLEEVLKRYGAEPFGTVGDVFDANIHEGAGEKEAPDATDGTVVEVVRRGWKLGNRILKSALVYIKK